MYGKVCDFEIGDYTILLVQGPRSRVQQDEANQLTVSQDQEPKWSLTPAASQLSTLGAQHQTATI